MNYYKICSRFIFKNFASLRLCAFALIFSSFTYGQTLAPGAPGKDAQWATAGKQGVGTSASLESKVWFTLAQGVMTEVYYPDVTVANVHLLQFVVVNKKTGKVETEKDDTIRQIEYLNNKSLPFSTEPPTSLSFYQTNLSKDKKWRIRKKYITDPANNAVLIDVEFTRDSNSKDLYEVYVYYDPSLNNSGLHDTAWTQDEILLTSDNDKFSALTSAFGFTETTNGFLGINDGLTQLRNKKKLEIYDKAENGNVVQFAKLNLVGGDVEAFRTYYRSTLVLGFGKSSDEAIQTAKKSLQKGFENTFNEYEKGWSDYVKTIRKVEPKYQAQFNMAAMQLKAHEDKSNRGANIASLSVPWGGDKNANENTVGGYHLIWSRDLYQVATAFMALGDKDAAIRALDFLFKVQQKPDGSFPQNSFLDGKPFWGSLQMDEVAFPLILAYQLGRNDKAIYENHVKKAADFIVKNGPMTPQERWEERSGYSPSTIAAEIAGLVCAAEIARKNGDETSANLYLKTADEWQANIEKWTATTNGKYGDGNYFLRITQKGNPNAGDKIDLGNGAGVFDEREIVDAGFLELVRLGIKQPDDPLIQKSLKVIDEVIRVKTPNGDAFYRYNHDGYGEMDDGRRWNWDGKYTGKGRLWALLSGERGQYDIARHQANIEQFKARNANRIPDGKIVHPSKEFLRNASERLDNMLAFANEGLMIPEQIWDKADVPNADKQFIPELKFGEGTGSATPLAWSMAQFIRLAVNLQEGKNLDTPDVVYDRYVLGKKSEVSDQKIIENSNDPGDVDIAEMPFNGEVDKRCFSDKPLFRKDCSYVSALAKENSQNPQIEKCSIGGFYIKCKNSANELHACFDYKGEFKTLEIAGDFTDWKPVTLKNNKQKDGNWIDCFNFAKTARVEYKLIVDGKWINDPLNPNKVDNGVGGGNSFFTMPDYKPTSWDKDPDCCTNLELQIQPLEIESKIYGKRNVKIYAPFELDGKPGVDLKQAELPVLYLQDGSDYINRAAAVKVQKNLVNAGKIKPFIIVFLDPKDRMKEYWANDDYAKYVAEEVVPAIDAKYKTVKSRDGRAIMGASLGGITSLHAAVKYPEIFGRVGAQSSSFWVDDERVVKELQKLDAARAKFKLYIDDGALEGVEDSRKVVKLLKEKSFDVTYLETEAGHNWTAWRDRLADAFIALWK